MCGGGGGGGGAEGVLRADLVAPHLFQRLQVRQADVIPWPPYRDQRTGRKTKTAEKQNNNN